MGKLTIVYSYERFSRSGINGATIAEELLKKYGVITLATTQELDPTTPSGSFQQKILFLFGQMDNEMRRDKVVTGMKELIAKGYWLHAPPIGYTDLNKGRAVNRKLVVTEQGKLLKKAFEWKAYQQLPNTEIAKRLQKLGFNISHKRLINVFSNPFYCGLITSKMYPGQVFVGRHEPLVSQKLLLQVHDIRSEKRSHPVTHNLEDENLPLKVFMKCEKCGLSMSGYVVKKKGLYYYKCSTKGCKVNRSAKIIHELFSKMLSLFQVDKEEAEVIKIQLEEQAANFFRESIEKTKLLKARLTDIQKKQSIMEERFAIGEIDRSIYDKINKKYNVEKNEIQQEINMGGLKSSNLKNLIDFAIDMCRNPLKVWTEGSFYEKQLFQNLLFPEGIIYSRQNDNPRTTRINSFFSPIPELARVLRGKNKADFHLLDEKSALVIQPGLEPGTHSLEGCCSIQLSY